MAIVGEAHIIVRAITTSVQRDITKGFSGVSGAGRKAGENMGAAFSRGFAANGPSANMFSKFSAGIRTMVPGADAARESLHGLIRTSYTVGAALGSVLGGISAIIGGLGALAGSAGGAIASMSALGNVFLGVGLAMLSARLALGGVGKALSALGKSGGGSAGSAGTAGTAGGVSAAAAAAAAKAAAAAQKAFAEDKIRAARGVQDAEESLARVIERNRENLVDANNEVRDAQMSLNEALKEGREEIQQIGFEAEDAALAESRAVIELNAAREALARVQDLPPNSRARQEAELAYQEADLNLRKARDASSDLNKEQDRLARTGVAGTAAVVSATQALAAAEAAKSRSVRDGLRDEIDANRELADARAVKPELRETAPAASTPGTAGSAGSAGSGGINPFEGLNDSQIAFVKFLNGLRPLLTELKKTASDALLPPLQEAIQLLADKLFPTLNMGVGIAAAALGAASISIAKAITETKNLENLGKLFESSGPIIESLGRSIGSLWGIVVSILTASIPLAETFVAFIESKLGAFDEFLKVDPEGLETFFNKAGTLMAMFGDIFGNIFAGLGKIIMANFEEGSGGYMMLEWLQKATAGFANMDMDKLQEDFVLLADNSIKVFSSIGALLDQLGDLGKNPAVGETFDILKEGAPALGDLLEKSLEAGPALAELVAHLVDFANTMTDTGAMDIFFDTLSAILSTVNDMLKNEVVFSIMTVIGRITAFLLAIGLVGSVGSFVFRYLAGSIIYISKTIGRVGTAFNLLKSFFIGAVGVLRNVLNGYYIKKTIWFVKDMAESAILRAMYAKDLAVRVGQLIAHGAKVVWLGLVQSGAHLKEMGQLAASGIARGVSHALEMGRMIARGAGIVALGVIIAGSAVAQGVATAAQWAFNAAMNANPISLIIIAIVALIAGLVWFFTQTEVGKAAWAAFTGFLSEAWDNTVEAITQTIEFLRQVIANVFDAIGIVISAAIEIWQTIISTALQVISDIWDAVWTAVVGVLTIIWETIMAVVTTAIDTVMTIVRDTLAIIQGIWETIWNAIVSVVMSVWNGIRDFVDTAINAVRVIIDNIIKIIVAIWEGNWSAIGGYLATIWEAILSVVDSYIKLVQGVITAILEAISSIWNSIWGGISSFFSGIWDGILTAVQSFGGFFRDAFSGIAGFVESAFQGVLGAVKGPINSIIGIVNSAISSLNGLSVTIPAWVPGVGGQSFGLNLPKIPRLAKGGTIQPSMGGTLAQIAEAGRPERVEPLDPDGLSKRDKAMITMLSGEPKGQGIIIKVYPSAGMNESELATQVSRELAFQMRKGAVS